MDRARFSLLAHAELPYCNPISIAKHARALELLRLGPASRLVDIGAGRGDSVIEAVKRYGSRAVAVELAPPFAAEARRRIAASGCADRVEVREQAAMDFVNERREDRFDAALCIGAGHALGGYLQTLDQLATLVHPEGMALIGEGYWKREPEGSYLEAMGATSNDYLTHEGNIRAAIDRGWTPLWCSTASEDEWDEYEWGYARAIELFLRASPGDPDAAAMRARSRNWRDIAQRWGRSTLGFGLYLLIRER